MIATLTPLPLERTGFDEVGQQPDFESTTILDATPAIDCELRTGRLAGFDELLSWCRWPATHLSLSINWRVQHFDAARHPLDADIMLQTYPWDVPLQVSISSLRYFQTMSTLLLSRDSGSPTLEQVLLMGCQRGSHDNSQGNSTNDSDLSLLSSSGISSVESSLTELMVFPLPEHYNERAI